MSWYVPLVVTFFMILFAELGDKTQLMTISFASKYPHIPVFLGATLAMSLVSVLGVLVGTVLFEFIPILYVKILSGLIFVAFGVWTLARFRQEEEGEDSKDNKISEKGVFSTVFIMTSLAEFGDKTQFAVIALTANYGEPIWVLTGAVLGFALIVGIGVILGKKLAEKVESKWIELGSGILFIVIGIVFIVEALL